MFYAMCLMVAVIFVGAGLLIDLPEQYRVTAWMALLWQAWTVVGGWFVGTSLFPIWLPLAQMVRSLPAVVPMTLALVLVRFPANWFGLLGRFCLAAGFTLSVRLCWAWETSARLGDVLWADGLLNRCRC